MGEHFRFFRDFGRFYGVSVHSDDLCGSLRCLLEGLDGGVYSLVYEARACVNSAVVVYESSS